MENTTQLINFPPFNEAEWIRLIFLLSDTQQWMNQMVHPASSKFTVPLIELLSYLRDASTEPATPIPGTLHFKRTVALDKTIGIDIDHVSTCLLTILTDAGGRIITAFPGSYKSIPNL